MWSSWAARWRWGESRRGRVLETPQEGGCFLLCSVTNFPELWRGEQSRPLGVFHMTDPHQAPVASSILWAAWFQTPPLRLTAEATAACVRSGGLEPQQAARENSRVSPPVSGKLLGP